MKHTATETEARTLARFIDAADKQRPVTITYLKEEKDAAGKKTGRLVETVRTIETYDVITTKAGHIVFKAMDRETQKARSFRLDRIRAYTVHRTGYTVERPAEDTEATAADPVAEMVVTTPEDLTAREIARDDADYWTDVHSGQDTAQLATV